MIPLFAVVIVKGHRPALLRRIETGLALLLCVAMAWTVVDGPVFMATTSDGLVKFVLMLAIASTLIHLAAKRYRRVRPAPN